MILPHQILEACACNSMQEVYLCLVMLLMLLGAVIYHATPVCSALAYCPGEPSLSCIVVLQSNTANPQLC